MELQTITYVVVGMSFALYLGIAFWARAGSTSEFYVAGGDVNPVVNGMATAADGTPGRSSLDSHQNRADANGRWISPLPYASLRRYRG